MTGCARARSPTRLSERIRAQARDVAEAEPPVDRVAHVRRPEDGQPAPARGALVESRRGHRAGRSHGRGPRARCRRCRCPATPAPTNSAAAATATPSMLATQFRSGSVRIETGPPMGDEPRLGGLVIESQAALLHRPPAVESGRVDDRLDGQPGRHGSPARPPAPPGRSSMSSAIPALSPTCCESGRDQPVLEVERTRGRSHEPAPAVGPSRQPGHRVVDPARGRSPAPGPRAPPC